MPSQIEQRKAHHLKICLEEKVEARRKTSGFHEILFVHKALPEIERESISLSTNLFGHEFYAPIIVGSMTGGSPKTVKINVAIAKAVEELGLGMGIGSQRAALEDPMLKGTFAIVREKAPTAFLIANIGGSQLARGWGVIEAEKAVEMIEANALAIHLNPLQECIQFEGETDHRGVLQKIIEISRTLDVPVIVKETGAGIAAEEAKQLEEAGVSAIDIAGAGGTSWAAVEYYRAKVLQNELRQRLGETFWDWGIPTAASLIEVIQSVNLSVIASGGIRNGIDIGKALALGANLASISQPILRAAAKGSKEVVRILQFMIDELTNTMFLVGAESAGKLIQVPIVVIGKTAEWLRMRGFQLESYARRKI